MIYPDSVRLGQATQHNAVFLDLNNQPIIGTGPAIWSLVTPSGDTILTGTGTQLNSSLNPERWSVTLTVPTSAPATQATERYRLVWTLPSLDKINTFSTSFRVVTDGDVVPFERDLIVRHLTNFVMQSPSGLPATVVIYPPFIGSPAEDNAIPAFTGAVAATSHTILGGLTADGSIDGAVPYVAVWDWTDGGNSYTEMQMIYVISIQATTFINSMRRDLDKARNRDINPALQFSDIDLLHYGMEGFTRLNATPPVQTTFTMQNCPESLRWTAKMCGIAEAARAQYLAESVSGNFDFSGMSVQLNIDRAGPWQTYYDMVNSELDDKISRTKKQIANSFSAGSSFAGRFGGGALGVTLGPTTNIAYMYSGAWTRSSMLRYAG